MQQKLTHREEAVMRILWRLGNAFVKDILEQYEPPKPPYNTISSVIRKLEKDGVVGYEAFGKTHRYFPILKEADYRKYTFRDMMRHYFKGSPKELLSYFVEEESIDPKEIAALLDDLKSDEQ